MGLIKWFKKERISIDEIEVYNPQKELRIFTAYSVFFIFVVFIFSLIIKYFPLPILGSVDKLYDVWYVIFIKIIFLLIIPLYIFKKFGYKVNTLFSFKYHRMLKNIFVVIISFIIGIFLNSTIIGQIQGQTLEFNWLLFLKIFAAIIIPLIDAALPEEIFYRIILQTRIEKKFGWITSILISALLFALFHFPSRILLASGIQGTAGNVLSVCLGTLAPVFIGGLIFGFLWNRYRNIYLLIALHYGIDLLPSIASFIGIKI